MYGGINDILIAVLLRNFPEQVTQRMEEPFLELRLPITLIDDCRASASVLPCATHCALFTGSQPLARFAGLIFLHTRLQYEKAAGSWNSQLVHCSLSESGAARGRELYKCM